MVRFLLEKGFDKNRYYYVKCALQKAAAAGDLEFVKYIVANYTPENLKTCGGLYNVEKSLRGAASHGHLPVVQWLLTYMKTLPVPDAPKQAMVAAAKGGQLEVMRWLIEQFADDPSVKLFGRSDDDHSDSLVLDAAAEYGQLRALFYLHQVAVATTSLQTLHCSYRAVDHAAANGHLEVVKWLHENMAAECSTNAMDAAATCAHLLAPWPKSHNCSCGKPPKSVVARQIAMLQYLKDHFSRGCTTVAMDRAAARGNLKVLTWLHENTDTGCTTDAMDKAAEEGHSSTVKWLHNNRSEGCTDDALLSAAVDGHLKMVKWLCQNRSEVLPFTAKAMEIAARQGHLKVVKWLHSKYPKDSLMEALTATAACRFSSPAYSLPVVQWLLPRCPDADIKELLVGAVGTCRFEIALFLHAKLGANDFWLNAHDLARLRDDLKSRPEWQHLQAWFEEIYVSRHTAKYGNGIEVNTED